MSKRILAIGAHPDDIELGCSCLIYNKQSHILTLSAGEKGGPNRKEEAFLAAEVLGAELTVYDYPDTKIETLSIVDEISKVITSFNPSFILVPPCTDSHQDHVAVSKAAKIACRTKEVTILEYSTPSVVNFSPNWFFPLTEELIQLKLRSLSCHKSQQHRYYFQEEYIRVTSSYWSKLKGWNCPYVEAFQLVNYFGE